MNPKKEVLLIQQASKIGKKIKKRAKYYDANPQYQKENFELLKKARNEEFYGPEHSGTFNYIFYR